MGELVIFASTQDVVTDGYYDHDAWETDYGSSGDRSVGESDMVLIWWPVPDNGSNDPQSMSIFHEGA
eukprot:1577320-Lingulodinium_polyedra.AAC.1